MNLEHLDQEIEFNYITLLSYFLIGFLKVKGPCYTTLLHLDQQSLVQNIQQILEF